MAKKKKKAIKLQCTTCKQVNYFTNKTKNVEEKIELKKFCNTCRAHTAHKEMKK
ncbi:MAG: 50S ribosomal protein L33 [Candidatus Pacebacteria bacterium]|nr:50S ribosomal protein L33 [Candidatus Paceibacterota bacterium]